ncbi:NifX-associated protein [Rhodovastum atsumiense]|uniref:NifX-associated nitrogen fixation protein n=1 Tax=Rhodovastum atsumiense TaxID=504468 RepID=A0A5M6IZ94_9PROT|nr:NifX-associated nitrogen fixation protein [Rhodovastum atsumiense]KAA5613623.1 NifX-associated nitrogen fixation protein [Rhodovastum atsumiense]CAH2599527.1 NifX-associated protein [Rhodovastum atsumiense]
MSEAAAADPMATPFLQCLVSRIRAEDTFGAWENKPDTALLADYIVTKEERRAIPIIGDPDPDTLGRLEKFYQAIGLAVERQTGIIASPMMKVTHEGFGRVVLIAGKLVVYARTLRDVHRFGFNDLGALAADGMKAVDQAVAMIEAHPELARA